MCVYIYTYIYIYVHMYLHMHTHIHTHIHIHSRSPDASRWFLCRLFFNISLIMFFFSFLFVYIFMFCFLCFLVFFLFDFYTRVSKFGSVGFLSNLKRRGRLKSGRKNMEIAPRCCAPFKTPRPENPGSLLCHAIQYHIIWYIYIYTY